MGASFSQADLATRKLLPIDHPAFDTVRDLYECLLDIRKESARYLDCHGRVVRPYTRDMHFEELVANVDNILKIMREASL